MSLYRTYRSALLTFISHMDFGFKGRMLTYVVLFIIYSIQLAFYQKQLKNEKANDTERTQRLIVALNSLLLICSILIVACGWVFRSYFSRACSIVNAVIVGLSAAWLCLATLQWRAHAEFISLQIIIDIFLIILDAVVSSKQEKRDYYDGRGSSSIESGFYGQLQADYRMSVDGDLQTFRSSKAILNIDNRNLQDGFRVKLADLSHCSLINGPSIPNNLTWSHFSDIQHLADSSSCSLYRAIWIERGTPVALKLIKPERVTSVIAVAEFDAEEAVLSNIQHRHIIRLLGSGSEPRKFLVLELLTGGTLAQALGITPLVKQSRHSSGNSLTSKQHKIQGHKFSLEETLRLSLQLARALCYLHCEWSDNFVILHRDLKPDNVGFCYNDEGQPVLKLFDFGLSACLRRQREKDEVFRMTGNTGTLRYMAPEVVLGRPYNQAVDAYSFAVLSWQLASFRVPFREMGRKTYIDKVVLAGVRLKLDPRRWGPGYCALLRRCWSEDKKKRPDFKEIVAELEILLEKEETRQRERRSRLGNRVLQSISLCCSAAPIRLFFLSLLLAVSSLLALQFGSLSVSSSSGFTVVVFVFSLLVSASYTLLMSIVCMPWSSYNLVLLFSLFCRCYNHGAYPPSSLLSASVPAIDDIEMRATQVISRDEAYNPLYLTTKASIEDGSNTEVISDRSVHNNNDQERGLIAI